MITRITNGNVLVNGCFINTDIYLEGKTIVAIGGEKEYDKVIDANGNYVSPGFIDIHCHGGGGADFADGEAEQVICAAKTHLLHGTTTLFPTIVSADFETLEKAIQAVESVREELPMLGGIHLEGPYFSPNQTGAQNGDALRKPIYGREDIDVEAYSYSPKVIDTESEYFFSATEVVNKDNFGEQYLVKPYWITKDGTTVWGVSRCVTVNEAIDKNVIHIPVKMDEAPTTGTTLSATDGTNPYTLTYCNKYDADTGYAHFALTTDNEGTSIKTDALKSVTTYTITRSDETTASYVYRNLLTTVGASDNRDTSWYSVILQAQSSEPTIP